MFTICNKSCCKDFLYLICEGLKLDLQIVDFSDVNYGNGPGKTLLKTGKHGNFLMKNKTKMNVHNCILQPLSVK